VEEVCGQSIPQKEAGGKGLSASKVRSPTVLSVSGLTSLNSPPGGAGGLTSPQPTQGSFEKEKGLVLGEASQFGYVPIGDVTS
jgi:hypothetical protein